MGIVLWVVIGLVIIAPIILLGIGFYGDIKRVIKW